MLPPPCPHLRGEAAGRSQVRDTQSSQLQAGGTHKNGSKEIEGFHFQLQVKAFERESAETSLKCLQLSRKQSLETALS